MLRAQVSLFSLHKERFGGGGGGGREREREEIYKITRIGIQGLRQRTNRHRDRNRPSELKTDRARKETEQWKAGRERERERERERDRETETDRQTDRQRQRQTDRQTGTKTHRP